MGFQINSKPNHDIPSRPWQKVGSDLFELQNGHFLVCVDYYSDFIEVDKIYDKKGKSVISKLKSQFARHGIPNQLVSDSGPPCNRPFHGKKSMLGKWGRFGDFDATQLRISPGLRSLLSQQTSLPKQEQRY